MNESLDNFAENLQALFLKTVDTCGPYYMISHSKAVLADLVHFWPNLDPTSEKTGSGSDLSYKIPLT
jgi:hypothetical protein